MENYNKYCKAFAKSFEISKDNLENLEYNKIDEWDSIGHMALLSELEGTFDISIDTDDVVDFSSFKKGIEIVEKYGVELK